MDNFNGTNYMKNQFCSYEIAKQLKELEFDEECLCTYTKNDKRFMRNPGTNMLDEPIEDAPYYWQNSKVHESVICAPLWQQVIDWFREKQNIYINIEPITFDDEPTYIFEIINLKNGMLLNNINSSFIDPNEAREQAILKALELCQKEK